MPVFLTTGYLDGNKIAGPRITATTREEAAREAGRLGYIIDGEMVNPDPIEPVPDAPFTLRRLQHEVGNWSVRNFPRNEPIDPALGVQEELGELAVAFLAMQAGVGGLSHALLKSRQKIRGDAAFHRQEMIDAVGDLVIFLADFCQRSNVDLEGAVKTTWNKVSKRNWRADPIGGATEAGIVIDSPQVEVASDRARAATK